MDSEFGSMSINKEELNHKKGLSKFYEGKSRRFSDIFSVETVEDLVKNGRARTRKKQKKMVESAKESKLGLRPTPSSEANLKLQDVN